MAQYKVPQDVEADDKLLGPFSFRQFIYLMIAAGLIATAVGLFQIFPLLAIIPLPLVFFFAILALPLKKDQPMETYLAALVSFYLKPRKRYWVPGQRESTIQITAPKVIEKPRTRSITGEEAGHRLSFLAEIVDTEGQAIKNSGPMRDDFAAEAATANDMFDNINTINLNHMIDRETSENHADAVRKMRQAIDKAESLTNEPSIQRFDSHPEKELKPEPKLYNPVIVQPHSIPPKKKNPAELESDMTELANNSDYSVQTIQQQANRINQNLNEEVYISLR